MQLRQGLGSQLVRNVLVEFLQCGPSVSGGNIRSDAIQNRNSCRDQSRFRIPRLVSLQSTQRIRPHQPQVSCQVFFWNTLQQIQRIGQIRQRLVVRVSLIEQRCHGDLNEQGIATAR
jgi:hypothetical protein